ncbi:hypothetical protein, partial [Xanthomonas oryzae]
TTSQALVLRIRVEAAAAFSRITFAFPVQVPDLTARGFIESKVDPNPAAFPTFNPAATCMFDKPKCIAVLKCG